MSDGLAIEVLRAVATAMRELGVRWYVFGAQAAIIWGSPPVDVVLAGPVLEDEFLARAIGTHGRPTCHPVPRRRHRIPCLRSEQWGSSRGSRAVYAARDDTGAGQPAVPYPPTLLKPSIPSTRNSAFATRVPSGTVTCTVSVSASVTRTVWRW